METLIFNEEDNDNLYVAEFSRNIYENYDENESENEENNNIQQEEIQSERIRGTRRGCGRGRGYRRNRNRGWSHSYSHDQNNESEIQQLVQLPLPPSFNLFHHSRPLHGFTLNLPNEYQTFSLSPYLIFSLFFSFEQINTIVQNTNKYAYLKGAGEGRKWEKLTIGEFKIWLAMLIYAGIFKLPSIRDYWNRDDKFPEHKITKFMTLLRFEQIKRFIHISDCNTPPLYWYSKLDPLASHIRTVSKSICIPSSNISIDEMIARFSGRSAHTVRIKNKPTPEGYKVLSLCDAGYTYTFIFTSRIQNYLELEQIPNLNKAGNEVFHLVSQLPPNKSFNIYMDNFFSSINLFQHLRNNNIGACGTVCTNSRNFPKILKVNKKLDWDTLSGVVINEVLVILWMDNGPVTMLSTIHEINGNNRIERIRRRPRESSTNAVKVRAIFGTANKKALPIPCVIDDYNHFMGGVDIADQLRGYYGTQLSVRRTWIPLFFWLLDTSIINSYLIFKKSGKNISHKDFRIQLIWDLIKSGMEENSSTKKPYTRNRVEELTQQFKFIEVDSLRKQQYVTANFELSPLRLIGDDHFPEWREERNGCVWCKYLNKKAQKKALKDPPQSQLYCIKCNVALCCNKNRSSCFKDYHIQKEDNN